MVEVPKPAIRAPMELRKRPRSTISGSRAAPWMRVPPRASTAALRTLAVPVTVGPQGPLRSMVAPLSRRARAITQPRSSRKSAPRAASPLRCRSTGRSPMRQPPGKGTMARPRRANSGPRTQKLARIRRTSRQRARTGRRSIVSSRSVPSRQETSSPKSASTRASVRTSASCGTPCSRTGSAARMAAAIIGKAAFFEPPARTSPPRGTPPAMLKRLNKPGVTLAVSQSVFMVPRCALPIRRLTPPARFVAAP